MLVSTFFTVDSLGKVDKESLSQQTLMELLLDGILNQEAIPDTNRSKDISEWYNLRFNDENGIHVIEIGWYSLSLEGSLELKWLPLTLKYGVFSDNKLSGTVDLTCLPDSLATLDLGSNLFHGSINLTMLPASMKNLFLLSNRFSGKTDFSHLPASLEYLNVADTLLEGEISDFRGTLRAMISNVKDKRPEQVRYPNCDDYTGDWA